MQSVVQRKVCVTAELNIFSVENEPTHLPPICRELSLTHCVTDVVQDTMLALTFVVVIKRQIKVPSMTSFRCYIKTPMSY